MSADIKEIYDEIYYGCDIELKYGNWYYVIGSGGLPEEKKFFVQLAKFDHSSEENVETYSEKLYYKLFDDQQTMTETFLIEPLFEGKSFYEIAPNVNILTIF